MTNVEQRLEDLRRATEEHVRPSPDLFVRIERSLEPRTWWRWPIAVAAAGAMAVVLMVALLRAGPHDQEVASRPPTRAEYVTAMNQRCAEYVQETEATIAVFPTPQAYALVAENRLAALARSVERIRSVGAPADAEGVLAGVLAEADRALASARTGLEAARSGDAAAAAAALADADATVGRAGTLMADYGAEECRP